MSRVTGLRLDARLCALVLNHGIESEILQSIVFKLFGNIMVELYDFLLLTFW